ncbi:MAG: NAD(+)/NADH kinase [Thermoanaerobaculia bacterium]
MTTIGISAKINSQKALLYAAKTADDLRAQGHSICFDPMTAEALGLGSAECHPKSELGAASQILVTFGGDGTLLSVARYAPRDVPIIGVNMGTLGFLTEIRVEEFPTLLQDVLEGNFEAEPRVTFDIALSGHGPRDLHFRVLNDAVINKSALARIIEMRVEVAGQFVSTFRADGLIVSTPTGSTAYNLSAGGPIVYPTMRAVLITPICPHTLTNRPLVLPDSLEIEIGLLTDQPEIYLTLDGQEGLPINDRSRVRIRRSEEPVLLVQSPNKNYFDVLRRKLKWGE